MEYNDLEETGKYNTMGIKLNNARSRAVLLLLFILTLPVFAVKQGATAHHLVIRNMSETSKTNVGEGILTVGNTDESNKARIKDRMKYLDKVIEEIDKLLYAQNKPSREVLQKIKRLLTELDKMQKAGNH